MSEITVTPNDDGTSTITIAGVPSPVNVQAVSPPPPPPPSPPPPPPPPPPDDPRAAPVLVLSIDKDKDALKVGDTFTLTAVMQAADGSTTSPNAYRIYGFDARVINKVDPVSDWQRNFTALAPGITTIRDDFGGQTARLQVTVLNADGSAPPVDQPPPVSPPPPPPPPQGSPIPPTNDNATHRVTYKATDRLGRTWTATAIVGNDPTAPAQFVPFMGPDISHLVARAPTIAKAVVATKAAIAKAVGAVTAMFGAAPADAPQPVPHPALRVRFYADGCEATNALAGNAFDWLGFIIEVTYDGQTVPLPNPTNEDGTVDFWRGCASPMLRYGKQVGWSADRIDRSILCNYTSEPGTFDDAKKDYTFNGLGCASMNGMGSTGERDDIGDLDRAGAAFATNPCDETWGVIRREGDWDGNWDVFWCTDDGKILNVEDYPDANVLPKAQRSSAWNNPIVLYRGSYDGDTLTPPQNGDWGVSACPHAPNGAHLTSYGMVAAMVTRTARDRDHASFWGNWPLLEIAPNYRQSGGVVTGALRRFAWCLRSLFMAGYVSSDCEYFQRRTARQLEIVNAKLVPNDFGLLAINHEYVGKGSATGYKGLAPWMHNYLAMVLDQVCNKLPEWKPFAQYIGKWYVTWQNTPQVALQTIYNFICIDADGKLINDFNRCIWLSLVNNGYTDDEATALCAATTVEQVYNLLVAHYQRVGSNWGGKFVGGVSDLRGPIAASDSYPAGAIAGSIAAYNVGTPGADKVLAYMQALPTKPNYHGNQKYHLAPKAGVTA